MESKTKAVESWQVRDKMTMGVTRCHESHWLLHNSYPQRHIKRRQIKLALRNGVL